MAAKPVLYRDDGSEIELPTKWRICGTCKGHGKSSAYLGAFTRDDFDQQEPDFYDQYMAGAYDRACDRCDGSGKIEIVDRAKLTPEQIKDWEEQLRDDRECEAIHRAERAMGA